MSGGERATTRKDRKERTGSPSGLKRTRCSFRN